MRLKSILTNPLFTSQADAPKHCVWPTFEPDGPLPQRRIGVVGRLEDLRALETSCADFRARQFRGPNRWIAPTIRENNAAISESARFPVLAHHVIILR
jgi:hypothetical protein